MAEEEKTSEQKLIEEYDVGDHSYDPELDEVPSSVPAATPSSKQSEVEPASPPTASSRGPDGRFLPQTRHTKHTLRMAAALGYSDEEIADTEPAVLESRIKDQLAVLQLSRETTPSQGDERRVPLTEPSRTHAEESGDSLDLSEEEAAEIHGPIARTLKGLAAKVKSLESQLGAIHQVEADRANETAVETADRIFGEDEETFGSGKARSIKADSPEHLRRLAVWELAKKQKGSVEECLRKAREILYGKKTLSREEKPAVDQRPATDRRVVKDEIDEEDWREAALARPTRRDAPVEPKGTRRAEKAVAKKLRENGQTLDDFTGSEEAGLPD